MLTAETFAVVVTQRTIDAMHEAGGEVVARMLRRVVREGHEEFRTALGLLVDLQAVVEWDMETLVRWRNRVTVTSEDTMALCAGMAGVALPAGGMPLELFASWATDRDMVAAAAPIVVFDYSQSRQDLEWFVRKALLRTMSTRAKLDMLVMCAGALFVTRIGPKLAEALGVTTSTEPSHDATRQPADQWADRAGRVPPDESADGLPPTVDTLAAATEAMSD